MDQNRSGPWVAIATAFHLFAAEADGLSAPLMACPFCRSRLLSKAPQGLACCGCGRPIAQTLWPEGPRLSLKQWLLALVLGLTLLPLVGAFITYDAPRRGDATEEAPQAGEAEAPN